ncbi:MAG: hypothetical protein JRE45_20340 [Deltaproteobacteria bacterium]|nr:hypothetical protein [Deltaproteobacteria bacterium]
MRNLFLEQGRRFTEAGILAAADDIFFLDGETMWSRAAVRVVRDLHDLGNTEPGEILVAANIDPGWTHVFPMLAGLITETGGVLSHGALLAREYGIPAVMGISGATERFQTGETVEIDGSSGTVERIAEQDRQPGLHNAP